MPTFYVFLWLLQPTQVFWRNTKKLSDVVYWTRLGRSSTAATGNVLDEADADSDDAFNDTDELD